MPRLARLGTAAGACLLAVSAQAATLDITVSSTSPAGGVFFTPVFLAFHDGTYDTFDPGGQASQGVEDIAEEGDVSAQLAAVPSGVATAVVGNADGFPGAPVFDPGESTTVQVDVSPQSQRFLSFLTMVIPSNDAFLGNPDPMANALFDANGSFNGPQTIEILGGQVWDAGTEANDNLGAAFNAAGGTATDTTDSIALLGDLGFLAGQTSVAGTTVSTIPGAGDVIATISVDLAPIPLPAGVVLLGTALAGMGLLSWRRRMA